MSSGEPKDPKPRQEITGATPGDDDADDAGGIRVLDTAPMTTANNEDLPLDWTHINTVAGVGVGTNDLPVIRYPTDVVSNGSGELDVSDGECVMVGTAGQKITHMGPDLGKLLLKACEAQGVELLHKLILRSHLIQQMTGLEPLMDLTMLELYDNQVQALNLTPNLVTLTVLDMSYNAIRDMEPVQACPNLRELYIASNKLKAVAGLRGLTKLQKLDLGANRIRVMPPEEFSGLQSITEIWMGKNKIEQMAGLSTLTKLRRLDLQSNRLRELPGNEFVTIAPTLEELYLAHNGLTTVDGGGWLENDGVVFEELTVLDLSRNQFKSANALGGARGAKLFPSLEELWISGNQVADWSDVQDLKALSTLETLYLEYNPIQTADPLYRKSLAQLIPQLKQIDATLVGAPSRFGPSGLVVGAAPPAPATPILVLPDPTEWEEDRLRRFQEMAIQRAKQQQKQQKDDNDSDASGTEEGVSTIGDSLAAPPS